MQETDVKEFIANMGDGLLEEKMGIALSEVALGIMKHGGKGKCSLSLEIEQVGQSSQVVIKHQLKFQKPTKRGALTETDTNATQYYVNSDGDMTLYPRKGIAQFPGQNGPLFDSETGEVKNE